MTYNLKHIAKELEATASGAAYFGNALRVAKDIPGLTAFDRAILERYLSGANTSSDRFSLQDIIIRINEMTDPITEYYADRAISGQANRAK